MNSLGTIKSATELKAFGQPWEGGKAFDGPFKYELAYDPPVIQKIRRDS